MFRRGSAFILLSLLIVQILGFTVFYQFEQTKIRKQLKTYIKHGVSESQLRVFEFDQRSYSKLQWCKKNEFKRQGHFFDVIRRRKLPHGGWKLYCIDDVQESMLFANLNRFVDSNLGNSGKENPVGTVFSILNLPIICQSASLSIEQPFHGDSDPIHHDFENFRTKTGHLHTDSLPPEA
ncbi:MAG: hypothetical protein EP338_11515 [Bacteroidetes bacterium]|nr:MAG: hypothetical protein EP338_11515 [Bacteroidota bacterium]